MHWFRINHLPRFALAMFLLAGALSNVPGARAEANMHYEPSFLRQAERALSGNRPERALQILAAHREDNLKIRHRAAASGVECRAQLALYRHAEAKEACLTAMEVDTSRRNWRYFNNLGVAELGLGDLNAAREAFLRAAARSGYAKEPRVNLGVIDSMNHDQNAVATEQVATNRR